jgi:soluble cytochrome b562
MIEWMENVEKAISRIMADKVYTSAEFKRERDNFHALCKDLERAEVKKWLQQILEILMAERGKEERSEQIGKLDGLIKKHEELIPTVLKTQVKVDLYWKCYAYGDELKPHIEFLDGIMLSSTRDIAPSCVENVDELIERQEKSLSQLETKRAVVKELIAKGKQLLENPDDCKPKFLDSHVKRIEEGWDDTKDKAQSRLTLLQNTKDAWVGYADGLETIVVEFEKGDEEIKKIKKRFNLAAAFEDLEKRQKIYNDTKTTIESMFGSIEKNYDCMTMTLPEDKKDFVKKEVKAVSEKLVVVEKFREKVEKIENFVNRLTNSTKA